MGERPSLTPLFSPLPPPPTLPSPPPPLSDGTLHDDDGDVAEEGDEGDEGDFESFGGREDRRKSADRDGDEGGDPSRRAGCWGGDRGGLGGGGRGALAEATAAAVEGNTIRGGDAAGPSPKSMAPTVSPSMSLMSGFSGEGPPGFLVGE